MLYKYPQAEYPYARLVAENRPRGAGQPEYELVDTGVLDGDRYFDVCVEYAQAGPDDNLDAGHRRESRPGRCRARLVPQLWYRNTWRWQKFRARSNADVRRRGGLSRLAPGTQRLLICMSTAKRADLLFSQRQPTTRSCRNDTPSSGFWKDAFHERIVKSAPRSRSIQRRLAAPRPASGILGFSLEVAARSGCAWRLTKRQASAATIRKTSTCRSRPGCARRMSFTRNCGKWAGRTRARYSGRRFAGMIWSKQYFHFDVPRWLAGQCGPPTQASFERELGRNRDSVPSQRCRDLSRCRRVGISVVCGLGPRLSLHSARADLDPVFGEVAARCYSRASGTCIRTGRCRPTSWHSAM